LDWYSVPTLVDPEYEKTPWVAMSLPAPGVFVFFIVEPGDLGPTAGLAGLPGSLIVRLPKWQ